MDLQRMPDRPPLDAYQVGPFPPLVYRLAMAGGEGEVVKAPRRHAWATPPLTPLRSRCVLCGTEREERLGRGHVYLRPGSEIHAPYDSWREPPCREPPRTSPLVFSAPGTALAVMERRKTVTRRLAKPGRNCRWKAGRIARAYERQPFLRGAPFAELGIVSVERETLGWITWPTYARSDEVEREGTEARTGREFVELFAKIHRMTYEEAWQSKVHRISFSLRRLIAEGDEL